MDKIKVVVVDDMSDIRNYICGELSKESDIEILGEAATGAGSIELLEKFRPDVVLMDISMETPTAGLDAAETIHSRWPDARVIILTIHEDEQLLFRAYCAGVMDYMLKTAPAAEIAAAVRNVHNNQMTIRPNAAAKIVSEFARIREAQDSLLFVFNIISHLTNSEFDVLCQAYNGAKQKSIANMRFVSIDTVKHQINSILRKFQKKKMKDVITMLKKFDFESVMRAYNNE
jgi:DNA-binding NarL/FixJ family response regulator